MSLNQLSIERERCYNIPISNFFVPCSVVMSHLNASDVGWLGEVDKGPIFELFCIFLFTHLVCHLISCPLKGNVVTISQFLFFLSLALLSCRMSMHQMLGAWEK